MDKNIKNEHGSKPLYTWDEINEEEKTILTSSNVPTEKINEVKRIIDESEILYITGSGSSFFCAYLAKYLFGMYAKPIPELIRASQLKFLPDYLRSHKSAILIISQSGRTDDVISVAKLSKTKKIPIISIVNDLESPLASVSTIVLPMQCGIQNSVVATKSIIAQFILIYKIIGSFKKEKNINFHELSEKFKLILKDFDEIKTIAKYLKNINSIHVLGNGIHFPVAQEGSRKLEELVRINSKENVSDELIHGPIATFDEKTVVIFLNPVDDAYLEKSKLS